MLIYFSFACVKLNVLVLYVLSQFKLFVFVVAPVHDLVLDREIVVCPDLGLVRSVTERRVNANLHMAHFSYVVLVENEQILTLCFVLVIPGLPAQGEVQHRMLTDLNTDDSPHSPPCLRAEIHFISMISNTGSTVSYKAISFLLLPHILMKAPCKSITIIS